MRLKSIRKGVEQRGYAKRVPSIFDRFVSVFSDSDSVAALHP